MAQSTQRNHQSRNLQTRNHQTSFWLGNTRFRTIRSVAIAAWCVAAAWVDSPITTGQNIDSAGYSRSVAIRADSEPTDWTTASVYRVEHHGGPVAITAMDIATDGRRILIAGEDDVLRLVDAASMTLITSTGGHRDRVRCVSIHPSSRSAVTAGHDGRVMLWSISRSIDGPMRLIRSLDRAPAIAEVVHVPSGSRLMAAGFSPLLYDLPGSLRSDTGRPGETGHRIDCGQNDLRAITFTADDRIVVAGRGGVLHVFENGIEVASKPVNPGAINDLAMLPGTDRVVAVCDAGIVTATDLSTGEVIRSVNLHTGRLFAVVAVASDVVAVAGSDDAIRIIDLSNGQTIGVCRGHRGSISALASVDGALYSAGFDATVRRWSNPNRSIQSARSKQHRLSHGGIDAGPGVTPVRMPSR